MRFKTFIVIAVAIAMGIGGYTFQRVEHSIHQQGIELAQERLNACKFKLYDLAVGSEGKAAHLAPGPQHNVHEAQIIAGALNVVNTIPSAKECIPVIKKAIKHQLGPQGLTPKLEHELIKLAVESNTHSNTPLPDSGVNPSTPTHRHKGSTGHKGHKKAGTPTTTTTPVPPLTVTTTPAPSTPKPSTPKAKVPPVTVPSTKTPPVKTPPIETPPITTPPVEVPPITVPAIEVPPIKLPPVEVPPIKINLEEPICTLPIKLLPCPAKP
jgi:hypothetical protein